MRLRLPWNVRSFRRGGTPAQRRGLRRFGWLGLGLALAGALTFAACRFTASFESTGTTEIEGVGTISWGARVEGGWGDFHNETDRCAEVEFRDNAGNVTGKAKVRPGANPGVVPPGSKKSEVTTVPCEGEGQQPDAGSAPGMRHLRWDHSTPYVVFGGPLEFEEDSPDDNAFYSFVVRAHSIEEAQALTATMLAQPIGTPIDPRVTILTYFRAIMGPTSASVIAIAREPFVGFEMDVNGIANYATLDSGASQRRLSADLWIVEAPVAYSDIHGLNQWNDVVLRTQQSGEPQPVQSSYAMIHNTN